MYHLEAGLRIEALTQSTERTEAIGLLSEPLPVDAPTAWDSLDDAMGWALHESVERGGQAIDVVSELGTVVARVSSPAHSVRESAQEALGTTLELVEGIGSL
jgi:hypothetical protein